MGFFVPLDNRERIEQLKFTAREMASEAVNNEWFENSGLTNQQLALDMWNGAKYMCRAHEENTVRNIFLSSFLERLREQANATRVQPPPLQSLPRTVSQSAPTVVPSITSSPAAPVAPEPRAPTVIESPPQLPDAPAPDVPSPAEATDEFLGIVPSIDDTPLERVPRSYDDEDDPGYDAAIEAIVDRFENEELNPTGASDPIGDESEETPIAAEVDLPPAEPAQDIDPSADRVTVSEVIQERCEADATGSTEPQSIESIVISDKEPYNFDSCTIKAAIQLLPEDSGIRKCVVSIRSHDFVPQINISEVANGNLADDVKGCIETAFEQYRAILPVLAAEQVKKDKPAAKKRSAKPAEKTRAATKAAESKDSAAATTQTAETPQGQSTLFAS